MTDKAAILILILAAAIASGVLWIFVRALGSHDPDD